MTILIILLVVTTAILGITVFFCFRFAMTILRFEEQLELSLDIVDESYREISTVLETPLFYDSREVRSTLDAIARARHGLLELANVLTQRDEVLRENDDETTRDRLGTTG